MRLTPNLALLLLLLVPHAAAADDNRILHRFDFEERDDGNYEQTPMHWARVVGPGLPHYCRGRLSSDAARTGRYSFRLDLDGGSLLYRLAPDLIHVEPDAHYRVGGFVRTSRLRYAKARLTAWFVDDAGLMIPGSVRHSRAYAAGDDDTPPDGWAPLSVEMSPQSPEARGIVLELGLLQPDQLGPDAQSRRDGERELTTDLARFRQDVDGTAWFDDVVVSRVPAVHIQRGPAGNVFPRSRPVTFTAIVDDKPLGDLAASVRVSDADGRLLMEAAGAPRTGKPGEIDFALPPLPAGWYEASFTVAGRGMTAADGSAGATVRRAAFAVLADDLPPGPLDARVTVDATHLSAGDWEDLPLLLPTLAAGRVKLGVWSRDNDLTPANSAALDDLMAGLDPLGIRPTAVFAGPTRELAEASGGVGWADFEPSLPRDLATLPTAPTAGVEWSDAAGSAADLTPAAELWHSSLSYLVSRHAQQIDRWQIGRDDDAERFARDPRLRRVYAAFDDAIRKLAARPDVAMPWPARAGLAADEPLPRTLSLRVPADVTASQIPLYVGEILRQDPLATRDLSLSLEPLDADRYGRLEAMSDLAKRLTLCLASGVGRVTVPMPFDPAAAPGDESEATPQQPRESYMILRTMLRNLAGCAYQGRVAAGPGVEAFLFAPPGGGRGVLVLWNDRAGGSPAAATTLQMNLGDAAEQIDLWGNATPLTQAEDDRLVGRAELRVGAIPTLVVGVDAGLTRLRSLVRLDDATLESSFEPHARRLSFSNPFPTPLSGRIVLRGPDGWETSFGEAGGRFSLPPGGRFDRPFTIRFPYNSYAGEKTIDAEMTVRDAAGRDRTIRVPLTLTLGLADTSLRTSAWVDGRDVVVEQTIRNHGQATAAWTVFVLFPDRPRQERLVVDLGPGQSVVRTHRFPDAAATLVPGAAVEIRSGLRELEGMRILNDKVELQ